MIQNKINFSAPDATIHILEIDKWADLFLMLVFSTKNICMQLERDLFSALHISRSSRELLRGRELNPFMSFLLQHSVLF